MPSIALSSDKEWEGLILRVHDHEFLDNFNEDRVRELPARRCTCPLPPEMFCLKKSPWLTYLCLIGHVSVGVCDVAESSSTWIVQSSKLWRFTWLIHIEEGCIGVPWVRIRRKSQVWIDSVGTIFLDSVNSDCSCYAQRIRPSQSCNQGLQSATTQKGLLQDCSVIQTS